MSLFPKKSGVSL